MQLFTCPFCGKRAETEFHFGGDAGTLRPEGDVAPGDWADYLHFNANLQGVTREIWMHLTCHEIFVMERDTVTHEVIASEPLAPEAGT